MIIVSKCPYRVSLLGGGSDLDWFVEREDYGISLGYPFKKHSYIVINKLENIAKEGILNYSSKETYKTISEIAHPIIKATLEYFDIHEFMEISSFGFASGGSGLGGSSSFLISLINGLSKIKPKSININKIADYACDIEINKLKKPIGRQDQYICSSQDIACFKYQRNGVVIEQKLHVNKSKAIKKSIKTLYLIPTGIKRSADLVLNKLKEDKANFLKIRELRKLMEDFLIDKNSSEEYAFHSLNNAIQESWEIKKNMTGIMNFELENKLHNLNNCPNYWIRLVGAGAGGYFLLSSKLNEELTEKYLKNLGFEFFFKPEIDNIGPNSVIF